MANHPRVLSLGFAGGGISSLLFSLLHDFASTVHTVPEPLPAIPQLDCNCPVVLSILDLSERELCILGLGILIGLFVLPFLELLLTLRQAWTIWLRSRLITPNSKHTLYRDI